MSKSRRILVILIVSLASLVLPATLFGAVMEAESAPEMLTLAIIPQSEEPVPAGEPAVFKVLVKNDTRQNQTNLVLNIAWDVRKVDRAKLELVEEETQGVRTQGLRREEGMAVWRGGILAGGQLTMRLTLLPVVCNDETLLIGVDALLGQASGGDKITASDSLKANCGEQSLTAEDLLFQSSIATLSPYDLFGDAADILTGMDGHLKIELTNKSGEPMNALVTDILTPMKGQETQCAVLSSQVQFQTEGAPTLSFDRGYLPPAAVDQAADGSEPFIGFMVLEIPPGETWTAELRVPLRSRAPGCEFSGMATVYPGPANPIPRSCDGGSPDCRYRGWSLQARDLRSLMTRLPAFDSNGIRARLVAPDLGDAPASENNFDEIMQAYSGINADFPTVYNLKIGIPPAAVNTLSADHREAPIHFYARPLRLGQLASIEREADINPNRNIDPQTDSANLDYRDDGWPGGELPGSCVPFEQKVRITVEDWAVNYFKENGRMAYLNVFVDANGDGDWEDAGSCGGRAAPEHLIINLPIDITALGAGQHEIDLPANRGVQWQTAQTWLRLTLGDEEAPLRLKIGNSAFGDGGGPENGYYLGETEDYRFRVGETRDSSTAAFGADLALRMETDYQFMGNHSPAQLAQTFGIRATECLTCIEDCYGGGSIITLGNLGDLFAPTSKLVVLPDPALRSNDVKISVKGDLPWTDTLAADIACSPADPDCRVEIDLGDVPPNAFGSLFVYASASCRPESQACKKTEYAVRARVESAADENKGNNQTEEKIKLPLAPEWLEPPSITYPIPGTMAGGDLHVKGGGKPGRTIEIYLNGLKVATGDVNNDGFFDIVIPALVAEGEVSTFQLAAGYEIPGGKRNPTRAISVVLDNETGLFIDPMSLTFRYTADSKKYAFHPWDENGRVDPNGWRVPFIEGSSYDVSVSASGWYCLTCTLSLQANGIFLAIGSQTIATLTDNDGDGTFNGSFTANQGLIDKPLTLNVSSDGVEQGYHGVSFAAGKLPRLIDGQTGQIVDGADFILWQSLKVAGDQIIMVRPQGVNGQPNPRTSGKNGEFFFNVNPGFYRLQISSPDGQLDSFTELQRTFGMFPTEDIILSTNTNQTNEPQVDLVKETVVSISADGFSPAVIEAGLNEQIIWQNIDLQNRGVRSLPEGLDSGFLPAGGTFAMSFDKAGSFVVEDPFDPGNTAVVIIKPGFGGYDLFLPALLSK